MQCILQIVAEAHIGAVELHGLWQVELHSLCAGLGTVSGRCALATSPALYVTPIAWSGNNNKEMNN